MVVRSEPLRNVVEGRFNTPSIVVVVFEAVPIKILEHPEDTSVAIFIFDTTPFLISVPILIVETLEKYLFVPILSIDVPPN